MYTAIYSQTVEHDCSARVFQDSRNESCRCWLTSATKSAMLG